MPLHPTHINTMGTRSRIGIEMPNHSVVSVYCHYDGYVEHNGKILVEHYQNRDDVQELIDGGSMSSLRSEHLWETKAVRDENNDIVRDEHENWVYAPTRNPQPLYHTERGDDLQVEHTSFDEFVSGDCGEEYAYLFDLNGNWKAFKLNWKGPVDRVEIPNYVTA
jgi:hypothetical protein